MPVNPDASTMDELLVLEAEVNAKLLELEQGIQAIANVAVGEGDPPAQHNMVWADGRILVYQLVTSP